MTTKEIVKKNEVELKKLAEGGVHLHFNDFFKAHIGCGQHSKDRVRFPKFVDALLEIGIDYQAMRATLQNARENFENSKREEIAERNDQFTLFVDAAMRRDAEGAKIGIVIFSPGGQEVGRRTATNGNCHTINGDYDQFAAECFGILKAIEAALEFEIKNLVLKNDRIVSFEETTKDGYSGAKYLYIAKKIAKKNNLAVFFERVSSSENLADALSRSDEDFPSAAELRHAEEFRAQKNAEWEAGAEKRAAEKTAREKAQAGLAATPVEKISDAKNGHGNFDIRAGLRPGLVHFDSAREQKLIFAIGGKTFKKLETWLGKNQIEFAPALTGFSKNRWGNFAPEISGFVVLKKDAPVLEALLEKIDAEAKLKGAQIQEPAEIKSAIPCPADLDERGIAPARDLVDGEFLTIFNFKKTRSHKILLADFLKISAATPLERRNLAWNLPAVTA